MITAEAEMTTDDEAIIADEPVPVRSVYLGLGTNIGDREANLQEAIERIAGLDLEIICASSIYETEPVGYHDQPWFLNQVIEANMLDWQILSLLKALQNIERDMGRRRTIPDGPRVIDIDILLYGDMTGFFTETWSAENAPEIAHTGAGILELPHPRLHLRRFVLAPLCEIAPNLVHPQLKKTCSELLAALDDPSIVRVYKSRV
jgi:2-amino-4-hydroxy-6-hydroxymethyldihydropteridine diphosphokinase